MATLVLAAVLTPFACGEIEETSLCDQYEDFVAASEEVQALEPEDLSAAEATEAVEDYLTSVRQLQESAAAEGRYGAELAALETAVADVLRTLESVEDDADYATWAPLVEDSLEDAADAAAFVRDQIGPSCTPADS